jgi:hypothetical protein
MSNDTETEAALQPLGAWKPTPPGDNGIPSDPGALPLSLPAAPVQGKVAEALQRAWIDYMVKGFEQNEEMFKRTLGAYMQPYYLTIGMYVGLFLVGIGLFVTAAIIGLTKGEPVVAIVFGGLGAGAFLAFFIRQPLQALEENLEFITWVGVSFNTYWTRLMYMMDLATIQQDLKSAEDDYTRAIERIISRHAQLRGKRPTPQPEETTGEDGKERPGTAGR